MFDLSVPCGIPGVAMTSVAAETRLASAAAQRRTAVPNDAAELGAAARKAVVDGFADVFGFVAVERLAQLP